MGDFQKHLKLAKEKLEVTVSAYCNKQMTVVGDLGTKVVEQLVEADAARNNEHFGDHRSRHEYSNKNFPSEINKAMRKIYKKIAKELSKIADIKVVVLYGSFARGEPTSRSDIDLLVLTTESKTQEEVQNKVIELESEIDRNIQPTIRTISELQKTDSGLLQNIFEEGKILYLKEPAEIPSALLLQQKPYLIYSFKISKLDQKEKARFNRLLYEQIRKRYKYRGLLNELGGKKLSAGCVMVPMNQKEKIEKFFKKFNVTYEQLKVWK